MEGIKKILIADDHAIFREGLKQVIASAVDLRVSDEATNGQETLNLVRENDYDIVILDVSMPGRSGLDCLIEIKKIKPNLPVLVLSMHPEEQYALRSYKAGALGYMTKGGTTEELVEALHKIALGKRYVSPALADKMIASLGKPQEADVQNSLSDREYQVLCLLASGKPVGKIANDLTLSVKTVSTYRSHILRKLNMKNNAELTRFAIENNLV